MIGEPKYEIQSDGRRYYDTADVAKIIRIVLKREFPTTKFLVRLKRYSGGSSIRVYYDSKAKGAPKPEIVESFVKNYVNHDFDGMTDSSIQLDHWMIPSTYEATVAHRGAMTFREEINNKTPKGAVRVKFGAGFVFVEDYDPRYRDVEP